jgi:hypothetical protein
VPRHVAGVLVCQALRRHQRHPADAPSPTLITKSLPCPYVNDTRCASPSVCDEQVRNGGNCVARVHELSKRRAPPVTTFLNGRSVASQQPASPFELRCCLVKGIGGRPTTCPFDECRT